MIANNQTAVLFILTKDEFSDHNHYCRALDKLKYRINYENI